MLVKQMNKELLEFKIELLKAQCERDIEMTKHYNIFPWIFIPIMLVCFSIICLFIVNILI